MDRIAESKTRLSLALRPVLLEDVVGEFLTRAQGVFKPATKRARRKSPNLIDHREVFCADAEQEVPREGAVKGEIQMNRARRLPLRT